MNSRVYAANPLPFLSGAGPRTLGLTRHGTADADGGRPGAHFGVRLNKVGHARGPRLVESITGPSTAEGHDRQSDGRIGRRTRCRGTFARRAMDRVLARGGLVGIGGYPELLDGGAVMAPRGAIYGLTGEWEVEHRGIAPDIEVDLSIRRLPARTRPARTGDRGNSAIDDRAPSAAVRAAAADRGGESACHPASDAARDGRLTLRREVLRSRDPSVSGNRRDCLTRGPGPNVLCHHLRVCTGSGAAGRHTRRILRARACARYRRHSAAPSADE